MEKEHNEHKFLYLQIHEIFNGADANIQHGIYLNRIQYIYIYTSHIV